MCVYAPFKSATLHIISPFHERDGGISFYKSVIHDQIYFLFFLQTLYSLEIGTSGCLYLLIPTASERLIDRIDLSPSLAAGSSSGLP